MEKSVLIDSNVFISLMRRGMDPASSLNEWAGDRDLLTCGMIRLEVLRGIKLTRVKERVTLLLGVMLNVPSDNRLWEEAAETAWKLDRRGLTLPAPDILIACCARRAGAAIMTDDGHFRLIPGIEVIPNPFH